MDAECLQHVVHTDARNLQFLQRIAGRSVSLETKRCLDGRKIRESPLRFCTAQVLKIGRNCVYLTFTIVYVI